MNQNLRDKAVLIGFIFPRLIHGENEIIKVQGKFAFACIVTERSSPRFFD